MRDHHGLAASHAAMTDDSTALEPEKKLPASGPWTDLALTLPIFVGYHLGVVFLPVRNAADVVTQELVTLADNSILAYSGLTLAIAAVFVGILVVAGRGHTLRWERFVFIALEAVVYAIAMRFLAAYAVGNLPLAQGIPDRTTGLVMSLGAGFYEEVAFRVIMFGLGAKLVLLLLPIVAPFREKLIIVGWAVLCSVVFSGWHYVGELGDPFELRSFTFRVVCSLVLTAIYHFRGFAPAVWTHTLYDIWVLVL